MLAHLLICRTISRFLANARKNTIHIQVSNFVNLHAQLPTNGNAEVVLESLTNEANEVRYLLKATLLKRVMRCTTQGKQITNS